LLTGSGAGVGGLLALAILSLSGYETDRPETVGLIVGAGAALGFIVGGFVGTGLGAQEAVQDVQDLAAQAFQRCMADRGYTVFRDRRRR